MEGWKGYMNHKVSTLLFLQLAVSVTAACQSDDTDDQDELQALLHDAPLTQVFPGATAPAPGIAVKESGVKDGGKHSNVVLPGVDPRGSWDFDDCTPFRTTLFDSSFN